MLATGRQHQGRRAGEMRTAPLIGHVRELRQHQGAGWPRRRRACRTSGPTARPGIPFSASTHRPESSATAGSPVNAAEARALSSAFSAKVAPVSAHLRGAGKLAEPGQLDVDMARGQDPGQLGELVRVGGGQEQPRRACTSGPRSSGQRLGLQPGQLGAAGDGQVEQLVEQARPNGSRSAVPWTSTNCPSPVQTTFMSVSAATSSS